MKTEIDLFEELPHIKSRLDDVFFIDEENTYLPHQWDDADSVNNMHFINGAWYSWQARVPGGYKLVPVETLEECLSWACCASSESWSDEQRDEIDKHYKVIEKAMIGVME